MKRCEICGKELKDDEGQQLRNQWAHGECARQEYFNTAWHYYEGLSSEQKERFHELVHTDKGK